MSKKQVGAVVRAVALAAVASLLTLGLVRDVGDVEAQADVKWVQTPDVSEFALDVSAYSPFVLADDFQCTESGLITQIHFWASWWHDQPPGGDPSAVAFTLSIHSDVPAGEDMPWSHPGELLWMLPFDPYDCSVGLWGYVEEGWFEPTAYYQVFTNTKIWRYSCPIPEPYWFQQAEGTVYWLDVQAMPIGDGMFGWKTSDHHWNDDGVWSAGAPWSELRYPPVHPLAGQSIDLAFQTWGQPCSAAVDTDGDTFKDSIECYLPTDRGDNCPDFVGDDAWPLDMDMNKVINLGGDVAKYIGKIGSSCT